MSFPDSYQSFPMVGMIPVPQEPPKPEDYFDATELALETLFFIINNAFPKVGRKLIDQAGLAALKAYGEKLKVVEAYKPKQDELAREIWTA